MGRKSRSKELARTQKPELDQLEPVLREIVMQQVKVQLKSYQGPIPDPETLAQYDAIVPGSAERIISRFEKQSDHRMEIEKMAVRWDINRARLGLYVGSLFVLGILGLAAYMVYQGQATAAGTMVGGVAATVLGAFVYGRAVQAKERKEKAELMRPESREESRR